MHPTERRFLAGHAKLKGREGFFYYKGVLLGLISGPLLWGRVAALFMRVTAATVHGLRASLQCYVDDPIIATAGSVAEQRQLISLVLLLWAALEFRVS